MECARTEAHGPPGARLRAPTKARCSWISSRDERRERRHRDHGLRGSGRHPRELRDRQVAHSSATSRCRSTAEGRSTGRSAIMFLSQEVQQLCSMPTTPVDAMMSEAHANLELDGRHRSGRRLAGARVGAQYVRVRPGPRPGVTSARAAAISPGRRAYDAACPTTRPTGSWLRSSATPTVRHPAAR